MCPPKFFASAENLRQGLLREWRNEKAKKAGSPPYILFTNIQLAEIAGKYPETLTQLASVEGVGRAKIKKGCVAKNHKKQVGGSKNRYLCLFHSLNPTINII